MGRQELEDPIVGGGYVSRCDLRWDGARITHRCFEWEDRCVKKIIATRKKGDRCTEQTRLARRRPECIKETGAKQGGNIVSPQRQESCCWREKMLKVYIYSRLH